MPLPSSASNAGSNTANSFLSSSSPLVHFQLSILAGGISGAIVKTVTAPLERIKLILQTQYVNQQLEKGTHYKGPLDCFRRILK